MDKFDLLVSIEAAIAILERARRATLSYRWHGASIFLERAISHISHERNQIVGRAVRQD